MNLILTIITALSFSVMAQTGTIDFGDVTITVAGSGAYVCSAQAMSSDRPVLARGESQEEAKALALQECEKQGNEFFCEVKECEKDTVNGNLLKIIFDIRRNSANIGISFKGNVKYSCTVKAWSKTYFAKAATKVEAKVLASNECANGNNGDAFFCKVKDNNCNQVSGTSGGISVGGILKDLFKR